MFSYIKSQKRFFSLLGMITLVIGLSAGVLLVQETQELREKADVTVPTPTPLPCKLPNVCEKWECEYNDAQVSLSCLGADMVCCRPTCTTPNVCVQGSCQDGYAPVDDSYYCPSNKICCLKITTPNPTATSNAKTPTPTSTTTTTPTTNPTGGIGGTTPNPNPSPSGSSGGSQSPKPSAGTCDGNKNPSTFTVSSGGRLYLYAATGSGVGEISLKKNTDTCSNTDFDKKTQFSTNLGKIDTGLDVVSGDKICLYVVQAIDGKAAEGWKEATADACGSISFADITAKVTADGLTAASKQCWGDAAGSTCEGDYNDFALIFAVSGSTYSGTGIRLRFQGITQKRNDQKITALFIQNGSAAKTLTDISVSNDETGVYTLPVDTLTAGTYDLKVKGHSHLQKLFSNLVYNGTGADLSGSQAQEMRAGDVTDDNQITIEDVSQVSAFYTDFSIPVSTDTKMIASDINKDGLITIQDLALIAINWSDFEVKGDN